MDKSKIELLDEVLSYLGLDTTWATLRQAFPEHDVQLERLKSILRKLETDGYINRFDGKVRLTRERGYVNDTRIVRSMEGELFIENGGYKKQADRANSSRIWKGVKTVFEVLIALATIFLSVMSYMQANKISKIEDENESLKAKIELMNTKIGK
jgi:hypothetical protein